MNLVICRTPFQVMLALQIIESLPDEKFMAVMSFPVKNEKYNYYADKLKQVCDVYREFAMPTDKLGLFKLLFQLKKILGEYNTFDKIFLASINEFFVHKILSLVEFNEINTFDDGTVNYFPEGPYSYYTDRPYKNFIMRLVYLIGCIKYTILDVRRLSEKHYTLYPQLQNIVDNRVQLPFPEMEPRNSEHYNDIKTVFIGQPIFEIDKTKDIDYIQNTVKKYQVQYYLSHPREKYILDEVEYIDTNLICEEYFLQQYKNNPHTKFVVYSFFSTAILYLHKLPNIEINSLKINEPQLEKLYKLFEKLGVNIIYED